MKELLIATHNQGKLKELKGLLEGFSLNLTTLAAYSDMYKVVEDGSSFAENATLKAVKTAIFTRKLTMGEDSGLEVEALNNEPGIYSARFSGDNATDEENNAKLLEMLKGVPLEKRTARYHCAIALADPQGIIFVVEGSCSGVIALEPKGTNGFGYDPLFFIPEHNKTFGELDPSIKSTISHRANALVKFKGAIEEHLSNPTW